MVLQITRVFGLLALFALIVFLLPGIETANAHFEHAPHFNGGGDDIGRYYAYYALEPEYAKPGEPAKIAFSVQDHKGNDLQNISAMVEIYEATTGKRIELFPFDKYPTGDFYVDYTFAERGNYNIVLSVSDKDQDNHFTPPRNLLSSTADCDCHRQIFHVLISESFGGIWNSATIIGILIPIIVLGVVLGYNFKRISKNKTKSDLRNEVMKYSMMFLGIAGGLIHIAVYAEHSALRIEYSYFLLSAAVTQLGFGMIYAITIINETILPEKGFRLETYRKKQFINLCGLIGTGVLVGLYIYAVVFPPPLSPNNEPEDVDLGGVLAKSVEIALMIGIGYIIKLERARMRKAKQELADFR